MALCALDENSSSSSSTGLTRDHEHSAEVHKSVSISGESSSSDSKDESSFSFLCHGEIVEGLQSRKGYPAVFCEGEHQQWADAHCADISDARYKALSNTSNPWICHLCDKKEADREVIKPAHELSQSDTNAESVFCDNGENLDSSSNIPSAQKNTNESLPTELEGVNFTVHDTCSPKKADLLCRMLVLEKEM